MVNRVRGDALYNHKMLHVDFTTLNPKPKTTVLGLVSQLLESPNGVKRLGFRAPQPGPKGHDALKRW